MIHSFTPPIANIFSFVKMLKVFGLLVLLSLSNSFECDENGYNKYLNNYYFKQGESNDYKELDV